jgi:hypothetical protein
MEGTPKRSKHVEAVNPLENQDILFSVFCFLASKVLARAAAVSRRGGAHLVPRGCGDASVQRQTLNSYPTRLGARAFNCASRSGAIGS